MISLTKVGVVLIGGIQDEVEHEGTFDIQEGCRGLPRHHQGSLFLPEVAFVQRYRRSF